MKKIFQDLIKLRTEYYGIDQGLIFVTNMYKAFQNLEKHKTKKTIIYNYIKDEEEILNVDPQIIQDYLYNMYSYNLLEFFLKNFKWCGEVRKYIYYSVLDSFGHEISDKISIFVINSIIQILMVMGNVRGVFNLAKFDNLLQQIVLRIQKNLEPKMLNLNNIKYILESKNFIIISNNEFKLSDLYINCAFFGLSLKIFDTVKKDSDIKFGSLWNLENLVDIIDFFRLKNHDDYFFEFDFSFKEKLINNFYCTTTDYLSGINIPYDDFATRSLLSKKFLLNDFCFHTITASMFRCYYFNPKVNNILYSKLNYISDFNPSIVYKNF